MINILKNYKRILSITIGVLFLLFFLSYYLIFTTSGSRFIVKTFLAKYMSADEINIEDVDGKLSERLIFKNIEIKDLKGLPRGSIVKIQEIDIYFSTWDIEGFNMDINSGRLFLPDSDAILFYGGYQYGSLNLSVYSKQVSVRGMLDMFVQSGAVKNISGSIKEFDVDAQGTFLEPVLIGKFFVEKLAKNGFKLENTYGNFNFTLKDLNGPLRVFGELNLQGGIIKGPKTATADIELAEIVFSGDPTEISLDFTGSAKVENTKINISVKGPVDKPKIKLTSQPPLPEERLLIMLATGRSWKQTEKALGKDKITPDVAADFVDYFFFSGTGSKMAQALGITDFVVTYDDKTKGVEVKKSISDKIDATYGVSQSQQATETTTAHKVGGEYAVTEQISVGAEKELKQSDMNKQTNGAAQSNDKVYLKYEQKF